MDARLRSLELSVEADINAGLTLTAAAETVHGVRRDNGNELSLMPADNARVGARLRPQGRVGWRRPARGSRCATRPARMPRPGSRSRQFDSAPFGTASTDSHILLD